MLLLSLSVVVVVSAKIIFLKIARWEGTRLGELVRETCLFPEPAVQLHAGSIATDSKWRSKDTIKVYFWISLHNQ